MVCIRCATMNRRHGSGPLTTRRPETGAGSGGVADTTDDPFGLRLKLRSEVEAAALDGNTNLAERGAAKAELLHRDREYTEAQEQSRRAWEDQREVIWRGHADTLRAAERAHDKEHDLWKLLSQ